MVVYFWYSVFLTQYHCRLKLSSGGGRPKRGLAIERHVVGNSPTTMPSFDGSMATTEIISTPKDEMNDRQLQDDCTARAVANELANVFEDTFASLTEELCDPFRRLIEAIRCRPLTEDSETSGSLECDIRFRCSGPCGDWIDESAIYQSQEEFTISNSCTCNSEGGAKRAPLLEDHISAINAALDDITITDIRV